MQHTKDIKDYAQKIKSLSEKATKGPWGIYNNGFDVLMVSGLRKADKDEYSTFDCGLKYAERIFGGEPSEGAFDPKNPTYEFIAKSREIIPECVEIINKLCDQIEILLIENKTLKDNK